MNQRFDSLILATGAFVTGAAGLVVWTSGWLVGESPVIRGIFVLAILVMVGLPARGKTFVARKLQGYLSWLGYRTLWVNVGDYRRARAGFTTRRRRPAAGVPGGVQRRQ